MVQSIACRVSICHKAAGHGSCPSVLRPAPTFNALCQRAYQFGNCAAGIGLMDPYHSVVVVGAGLSGLFAAQLLKAHLPDVLVLEAQDVIGGRVQQVHGVAPWPVEVGPEFVHGNKSKFTEVVKDFGFNFEEKPWPDWWYFGREGKLVNDDDGVDADVERVHELFDSVGDETPPGPSSDISAEQWLRSKGASDKMLAVADVCYANDFGCSLRQLGLTEMIIENQRWESGETYLIMDGALSAVVQRLAAGLDIRTSWPVSHIAYDAGGAVLHGPAGAVIRARKVVVTVPLPVLQRQQLAFSPPLPQAKQQAIGRLRMGQAVKLLMAFKRRFWPEDMYDVVCTDSFVPELWMTRHTVSDEACAHLHAITGFIAGERAVAAGQMPEQEAIQQFLRQLDSIFASPSDPRPASSAFSHAKVYDWSKVEWVGGAYSYPSLGAQPGDREALAAPMAGTVFFAGEASHPAVNPCMQAALETGERAAAQVMAAFKAPTSKL